MNPYLLLLATLLGVACGFLLCWLFYRTQVEQAYRQDAQAAAEKLQAQALRLEHLQTEHNGLRQERQELGLANARLEQELKTLPQIQQRLDLLQEEWTSLNRHNTELQRQLAEVSEQARARGQQVEQLREVHEQNALLREALSEKDTLLQQQKERGEEQLALLLQSREQLIHQLKVLSNEILEEKSRKFTETNKENMETILGPLREQIKGFRQKVEDVYDKESRDRVALLAEIGNLKNLNQQISVDALNLTNALKGQAKTQGTWGELILQRVLEMSGLMEGREYETEVHHQSGDGRAQRPDVIVHLPDRKDVIIDSKVSLVAYERYCSADTAEEREAALRDHLRSLREHVRELSERKYEKLEGVESLDYVLMFVPVEPALLTALERDGSLFDQALKRNVMLVCPSTLLGTLRIIENIWRYEHQSQNAQEIANRAGDLYDKLVGFMEEFEKIDSSLDKAKRSYDIAHKRLSSGAGNLIKRAEDLRKLGVKADKMLPKKLLEQAEADVTPLSEPAADADPQRIEP